MARKSRKKSTQNLEPISGLILLCLILVLVLGVSVNSTSIAFLLIVGLIIAALLVWYGWQRQRSREDAIRSWFSNKGYQRDLSQLTPLELETLVSILYQELGYQTELTPLSGDDGIDVKATKDSKLTVIQVKQSIHPVGSPVIQTLYGSMAHALADRAICVSSSGFTTAAEQFARHKDIELIDAKELLSLIRSVSKL